MSFRASRAFPCVNAPHSGDSQPRRRPPQRLLLPSGTSPDPHRRFKLNLRCGSGEVPERPWRGAGRVGVGASAQKPAFSRNGANQTRISGISPRCGIPGPNPHPNRDFRMPAWASPGRVGHARKAGRRQFQPMWRQSAWIQVVTRLRSRFGAAGGRSGAVNCS
jgi:hypothetical protein